MNKTKINQRLREIADQLSGLEKIETRSDSLDSQIDQLIAEFNGIRNTLDSMEGRSERVHFNNYAEIKADMETVVNMPGKIDSAQSRDVEPGELRFYDKNSLVELRSHIASQDKLGIENPNDLSFGKYVRGIITGDWTKSQKELRILGTATSGGGWLVPEAVSSQIITMSLAKSQVMNAGAVVFPFETKTVVIPKIASMPETEWKVENEKFSKSKDMTFEGITLESHVIMALISLSVELAQDGVGVPQAIEDAISLAISQEIDRVALDGSGSGAEPRGIINTVGVQTVDSAGITSYAPFSEAYYKIEAENGTVNALIAPSSVYAALDVLSGSGDGQPLQPPESWKSYKHLSSNKLVAQSVMGDFTKLLIGTRQTINIEVSREAIEAFERLQVLIRAYARIDIAVKYPKYFCVISEASS